MDNEYIVKIRLKRDIEVLFWISGFKKHYILSNQPEKKSKDFLEEKLDGWFSSIENRSHIEVAITNDPTLFDIIAFEPLRKNWRNGNCLGGSATSKDWGEAYPVSSRTLPLVFHLNARYRPLIEEYIRYGRESTYPLEYALQVILENAIINYLD